MTESDEEREQRLRELLSSSVSDERLQRIADLGEACDQDITIIAKELLDFRKTLAEERLRRQTAEADLSDLQAQDRFALLYGHEIEKERARADAAEAEVKRLRALLPTEPPPAQSSVFAQLHTTLPNEEEQTASDDSDKPYIRCIIHGEDFIVSIVGLVTVAGFIDRALSVSHNNGRAMLDWEVRDARGVLLDPQRSDLDDIAEALVKKNEALFLNLKVGAGG